MKKIQSKLGKLDKTETKSAYPKSQTQKSNPHIAKTIAKPIKPAKIDLAPKVNDKEYQEIEIQKAIYGGQFLSVSDQGETYIIDGIAEIAEKVQIQITERKPKLIYGQIQGQMDQDALKKRGLCPQLYECGGCAWQKMDEQTQLSSLERDIFHQIKATLKQVNPSRADQEFEAIEIEPTMRFAQEAWRCTARVHWDQKTIGFYQGKKIIDINTCMQFHPLVDEIYQALKSKLAHDLEGKGTVRISAAPDQSSGTLYFEEEQNQKSHIDKKYQKNTKTPTKSTFLTANLIQNIKKITQDPSSKIHGVSWKDREGNLQHWGKNENLFSQIPHAASSFVQAHQQGNQALIQKVVKACANHKGVIEIYAGSGNFTIPIAQMYSNPTIDSQNKTKKRTAVTAFEWDSEAVDQLRVMTFEQKLDLSVTNIKDEGVNEKIFAQDGYDCLLMDPPRAGANEIIQKLKQLKHQSIQTKLKKIVYVSCHAPALCRDLKDLLMLGEWKIKRLQLFNLFPHTGHIEVFCEITR